MAIISNSKMSPAELCSYVMLRDIFTGADVTDVERRGSELTVTYARLNEAVIYPRQISTHGFTCPTDVEAHRWQKLLDLKQRQQEHRALVA